MPSTGEVIRVQGVFTEIWPRRLLLPSRDQRARPEGGSRCWSSLGTTSPSSQSGAGGTRETQAPNLILDQERGLSRALSAGAEWGGELFEAPLT